MGRQRVAQLIAVAVAVVVVAAVSVFVIVDSAHSGESRPRVLYTQDVPADVRSATDMTVDRFRDRFAGRAACIDDVSIELVRSLDVGDARYVTRERRIEIRIPTTPARYRESLAHELAHHLERTCNEFESLRMALEPLLGGDGGVWSVGPTWQEIPSEQFAEAVVELVNGERIRHVETMPVEPEVLELIARWGTGVQLLPTR